MDPNDPNLSKTQKDFLERKRKQAARSAELAAVAQAKAQAKLDAMAAKKAEAMILDATVTERTTSAGSTCSALLIMKVVDFFLRFPNAKNQDCADACEVSRDSVKAALSTPMAKSRLESAYDIRPLVQERLKNQAMNAMEYLEMVNQRAVRDIKNDSKQPDSPLLSAAVRAAVATLQGVGVLKEHQIMKSQLVKAEDIHELVSKTDAINASFQEKLDEAMKKTARSEFDAEQVVEGGEAEN